MIRPTFHYILPLLRNSCQRKTSITSEHSVSSSGGFPNFDQDTSEKNTRLLIPVNLTTQSASTPAITLFLTSIHPYAILTKSLFRACYATVNIDQEMLRLHFQKGTSIIMDPVKVGVIGCGVIGSRHLSIASEAPHIELIAAADLIEANRKTATERFNPPQMYANGFDLLEDETIEAVVLAFPTQYRTEIALRAFEKGKHVLIEKPIAMNAAEVGELIAARGNLVSGCCSSRKRFTSAAQLATQLITTGGLGDLRTVHCRAIIGAREKPDNPRPAWRLTKALNGGGILVNWGCYDLDYLLGITGWQLRPQTVFAQTWTIPQVFESHIAPGSDAETHYTALIRCQGNIVLSVERGEFMTMHSHAAWEIIGTEGSLKLNMQDEKLKSSIYNRTTTEGGVETVSLYEAGEAPEIPHSTPLADFAAAIRENRQPSTNLEKALVVQKITDAIYTSAETGNAVEID